MQRIHVLHIPKTGGTAMRAALEASDQRDRFVFHGHLTTLADVPRGDKVMVGIRDPLSRFSSGSNSRRREGRPRYFYPWTPTQAEGFGRFATSNLLAEGLSDESLEIRLAANNLIRDILILAVPFSYWFHSAAYLRERAPDIIAIWRQEHLADDFEQLKLGLALPEALSLPSDPIAAHRGMAGDLTALSPRGRFNLESWYGGDLALYQEILDFLSTGCGTAARSDVAAVNHHG